MKGKIIVIEGTDCSGKETQSNMVVQKLLSENEKVIRLSFPMYDTPTGQIIGACLLGKPDMCNNLLKSSHSFFPEGGGQIDPLTSILYYAADRRYNLPILQKYLDEGYTIILDRYVTSNMAHRAGMLKNKEERLKIYQTIDTLEYEMLGLPRPDRTILLYMPYEYSLILKGKRQEALDETEKDREYATLGEKAYLELAEIYHYDIIPCVENGEIRSIEDINHDVYTLIKRKEHSK